MRVTDLMWMEPDDIMAICRYKNIRASSGQEALAKIVAALGADGLSGDHFILDGYAYNISRRMLSFIRRFDDGMYPEIDEPSVRIAGIPRGTALERADAVQMGLSVLDTGVASRLRRAAIFGKTPEECIGRWMSLYLVDEVTVENGKLLWHEEHPLSKPVLQFIKAWDDYPDLHFVIEAQLS